MAESRNDLNKLEDERRRMDEELGVMEARLGRLRVLYDQYFMGIEKVEPRMLRNELDKSFMRSEIPKVRSTVLKFRYRGLLQRYTSLKSYWDRIVRLLEDGRIRRGVAGRAETAFVTDPNGEDLKAMEAALDALAKVEEANHRTGPQTRSPDNTAKVFQPEDLDGIMGALKEAKAQLNQPLDGLSRETLAVGIGRIVEQCSGSLAIKVVQKGDKVTLVAVKKRPETDNA